jgi:hypothetical protein
MCELDGDIVLHLVGDHAQAEAVLELGKTPWLSRSDLMMAQPQHQQIGQDRNPERFFMPIQVAPNLMLAQPKVRFQIVF